MAKLCVQGVVGSVRGTLRRSGGLAAVANWATRIAIGRNVLLNEVFRNTGGH